MMGIERLALMFGGCVSYRAGARSTGGEALGRVELAGIMSGLRDHEVDYLFSYFGQENSRARLIDYVRHQGGRIADAESWRRCDYLQVGVMASLAVAEHLDNRCVACQGTGQRQAKLCCRCHGSGYIRLSGRRIADAIGIDHRNYERAWRHRYDRIYVIVQDVQGAVLSAIRRAERKDAVLFA